MRGDCIPIKAQTYGRNQARKRLQRRPVVLIEQSKTPNGWTPHAKPHARHTLTAHPTPLPRSATFKGGDVDRRGEKSTHREQEGDRDRLSHTHKDIRERDGVRDRFDATTMKQRS
jgi:hypothetical protein